MSEFWAEDRAQKVIKRHQEPYVVSDEKTPSGKIHVGALRGVVLHDAVARVLRTWKKPVRYIYCFDDYDPLDKIPAGLNRKAYEPFLGVPLSKVPAPDTQGSPLLGEVTEKSNFGRYFADEFESVYRQLGVKSETLRTSELYQQGQFNQAIIIALDNAELINKIYEEVTVHRSRDRQAKPLTRDLPINMICEQCGKIASTKAISWNGRVVEYQCLDDIQPFAVGCGYHGLQSPLDGNAKMPWKVEWAAKWFIWHSDIEGAGKDHYTKGGSRDVALAIFNQVFAQHLPKEFANQPEDLFYEWFYLGGAKMSTSRGVGVFAAEVVKQIPAELLRLLMVRTKPKSAVNFDPNPEAILRLFDEYDRLLNAYLENPTSQEGKIFDLARLREPKDLPQYVPKFSKIVYLVQMPHVKLEQLLQEEKGSPLTKADRLELNERVAYARQWLKQAPSKYRFEVQSIMPKVDLTGKQKQFLQQLLTIFQAQSNWEGETLHSKIHDLKQKLDISPQDAFGSIYLIFLNQNHGPQAGWFLASLDYGFVVQRLKEATV